MFANLKQSENGGGPAIMSTNKKRCFVIMPFSKIDWRHTKSYWNKHYDFLKTLIEKDSVFEAQRSEAIRADIIKEIITNLVYSSIVVADLTKLNPNVMYELGIRSSFPLQGATITIAEEGTKLPFDVSTKGTIFYRRDRKKNDTFSAKFTKAIAGCTEYPVSPDSIVWDVISGRGTFYEVIRKEENLRRIDALTEEMTYNAANIELFFKCIEEKKSLVSVFFRSPATELLLSTRYLENASDLYKDLEIIYSNILRLNNLIILYHNNWAGITTHFGGPSEWKQLLTTYVKEKLLEQIKALKVIRDKIENTC
ncbi:hypothetical protein MUP38_03375 [Candidatus Bathyarchaeota archaeon]|nr:hypothetical protein [Candidatus Bathyarchaeota archaeon]